MKEQADKPHVKDMAKRVLKNLQIRYPHSKTHLSFQNAWELLVATILSAQCTDERVNQITPALFERFAGPEEMVKATQDELEQLIHSAGFYRNKAKNILGCAKIIMDEFGGSTPDNMDDLLKLPGVARKTANIVLYGAYGINAGIAVDTHVRRISYRIGLTDHLDPVKIEQDLVKLFPQPEWGSVNHRLVWFGRDVCNARKPDCPGCEMKSFCQKKDFPKNL